MLSQQFFHRTRFSQSAAVFAYLVAVTAGLAAPLSALASSAISQGFIAGSQDIAAGTILSLVKTGTGTVVPAGTSGTGPLVGIAAGSPLVQLSGGGKSNIQVAVGGTTQALVSDLNGAVAVGDKIAASPIAGVGMKALGSGEVVGTSQGNLSNTVSRTMTDRNGHNQVVQVGLVPVSVNVAYFSAGSGNNLSAFVPGFLQDLANALSGKSVSPTRVLVSLLVLFLGTISVIVMLNTAIKSGIISIGRNPLAEKALRKGLLDVILAALGVLLITGVGVYAVIKS